MVVYKKPYVSKFHWEACHRSQVDRMLVLKTELRLGLFALIQAFNQMYNLGISADKSSKLSMTFGIVSCVTRVIAGRLCDLRGVSVSTYLTQSDNGNN